MNVQQAVDLCESILSDLEQLSDVEAAEEFSDSVTEKVKGIQETIERRQDVTANQERALNNMNEGVQRWLDKIGN